MTLFYSFDSMVRDKVSFFTPSITAMAYPEAVADIGLTASKQREAVRGVVKTGLKDVYPKDNITSLKGNDDQIHEITIIKDDHTLQLKNSLDESTKMSNCLIIASVVAAVVALILLACTFLVGLTPFASAIVAGVSAITILVIKCWSDNKLRPDLQEYANQIAYKKVITFQNHCDDVIWEMGQSNLQEKEKKEVDEKVKDNVVIVQDKIETEGLIVVEFEKSMKSLYASLRLLQVEIKSDNEDKNLTMPEKHRKQIAEIFAQVCVETPYDCTEALIFKMVAKRIEALLPSAR